MTDVPTARILACMFTKTTWQYGRPKDNNGKRARGGGDNGCPISPGDALFSKIPPECFSGEN